MFCVLRHRSRQSATGPGAHCRRALAFLAAIVLAFTFAISAFALRRHAQHDQLRVIVQEQCVPHWIASHQPAPCSSVSLLGSGTGAQGYAVLRDRKGGTHFLLIPTRTIEGIEDPQVLKSNAVNYFDKAWKARDVLETAAGVPLPRTEVGLAVNQLRARSQGQFHIHMSCLRPDVVDTLRQEAGHIGSRWTVLDLRGHAYHALRVMGEDIAPANPIRLLASGVPGAADRLAEYTILVAGEAFAEGSGFVLLAAHGVPGAELLLDSSCAVARKAALQTAGP